MPIHRHQPEQRFSRFRQKEEFYPLVPSLVYSVPQEVLIKSDKTVLSIWDKELNKRDMVPDFKVHFSERDKQIISQIC